MDRSMFSERHPEVLRELLAEGHELWLKGGTNRAHSRICAERSRPSGERVGDERYLDLMGTPDLHQPPDPDAVAVLVLVSASYYGTGENTTARGVV